MSDPIITFDHVVKEFKTRGRGANIARAVDDVSLTIDRGDIFGIIGYSGAGKSTLVRLINALERPTSGTVTVLGTNITSLSETKLRPIRQKIGMIFQQFNLFPHLSVRDNITFGMKVRKEDKASWQPRVDKVAQMLQLETLLDRCDDTDRRLFFGLLRGEKPEALQQELFLSPSALRHREKNLMLWAGCAAREDWQAFRAFCRALPLLDE